MAKAKNISQPKDHRLHLANDLEILADRRHEISGARLILARLKNSEDERFVTAWVAPWQKTVRDFIRHDSEAAAGADFNLKTNDDPPVTTDLKRDWQKNAVYGWEEKTIRRHDSSLSRDHLQNIVERVAKEFNLASAPTINARNKRLQWLADYDDKKNHIRIHNGQWRLSFVLHELAHAVDAKINSNRWADHSPSFMRTLLLVVEKYKYWHNIEELEHAADKAGIMIAPTAALPNLRSAAEPAAGQPVPL